MKTTTILAVVAIIVAVGAAASAQFASITTSALASGNPLRCPGAGPHHTDHDGPAGGTVDHDANGDVHSSGCA